MAIARITASAYTLSSTTYLTVTNPERLYKNTDNESYATITNTRAQTTAYYIYINGFNFDAIPDNAIVNSFTVKVKAKQTGVSTSTTYRPYLYNGTSSYLTGNCDVITTSVQTLEFTGVTDDWETIKGYGRNFCIRLCNRRNSRNTTSYLYVYGAEILVDYSISTPYDITASGTGCAVKPSGTTTVYGGDNFTLHIESDKKPTVTDNAVDVTSLLVEKTVSLGYSVETAPGASYGFEVNANGYYESKNKAKASSAAVCVVTFDLPVLCTVNFDLINYAESTYDYGLLSNLDTSLSNNASADTSNVYWNGKNNNSASVQTVSYEVPAGQHSIYVKYFKDSYTNSNNDTLQFKVRITAKEEWSAGVYYEYTIESVNEDHEIIAVVLGSEPILYMKENNTWTIISAVYKKVNGVWIEQANLDTLLNTHTSYVKGN